MFGYACDETPELMPAPIVYAHRLVRKQAELRRGGVLPWLRPDAKSQVSFRYVDWRPTSVEAVVLSTQHAAEVGVEELRAAVMGGGASHEMWLGPNSPTAKARTWLSGLRYALTSLGC